MTVLIVPRDMVEGWVTAGRDNFFFPLFNKQFFCQVSAGYDRFRSNFLELIMAFTSKFGAHGEV